ncbi:hypothetical protein WJX84_006939 [Apatococcus fuscideae]|uniref:Uncharacterized protein n=1 Tax=Apatococcus fuscideae TaxID=2026836 RepID=A0AAW1TAK0_9CHLO
MLATTILLAYEVPVLLIRADRKVTHHSYLGLLRSSEVLRGSTGEEDLSLKLFSFFCVGSRQHANYDRGPKLPPEAFTATYIRHAVLGKASASQPSAQQGVAE